MNLYDSAVTELISRGTEDCTDIFIRPRRCPDSESLKRFAGCLKQRVLCVFPTCPLRFDTENILYFADGKFSGNENSAVIFTGAGSLFDDELSGYVIQHGIRELLLMFADCVFPFSYASTAGMRRIADFRASLPFYAHLTAVFADDIYKRNSLITGCLGCGKFITVGAEDEYSFRAVKGENTKEIFRLVADECEKLPQLKTAVFFTERLTQEKFAGYLKKFSGISPLVFNGGKTPEHNAVVLRAFSESENGVLLATKSFLVNSVYSAVDRVLYLGMPPTGMFAKQLASLPPAENPLCFLCDGDIRRTLNIIRSQADFVPENEKKIFLLLRKQAFENMINLLNG